MKETPRDAIAPVSRKAQVCRQGCHEHYGQMSHEGVFEVKAHHKAEYDKTYLCDKGGCKNRFQFTSIHFKTLLGYLLLDKRKHIQCPGSITDLKFGEQTTTFLPGTHLFSQR